MEGSSEQLSILSKKIIKPSTPTPSTELLHKLNLFEQCIGSRHVPVVLFYPKQYIRPENFSQLLEKSLSKMLSAYYPIAGSLKDNTTVSCDDTGAELWEVRVNSPMHKLNYNRINDLVFPQGLAWKNTPHDTLSAFQITHFDCGGIAISACFSHKVFDGYSTNCFLRDLAALTQDPSTNISTPHFVKDSIIPSSLDGIGPFDTPLYGPDEFNDVIGRRFIISPSKLRDLKALVAAESGVQNPTRVEVVTALIFKSAALACSTNMGSFQDCQLAISAGLRILLNLPSPNSIGNLVSIIPTPIYYKEEELTLPKLVADIRKSKQQLSSKDPVKENELLLMMLKAHTDEKDMARPRNCDMYEITSFCSFPLHDLDFGFGKPTRACLAACTYPKLFTMTSTNDGGIEVCVNLNKQDMIVLEQDKDLLHFATPFIHEEDLSN